MTKMPPAASANASLLLPSLDEAALSIEVSCDGTAVRATIVDHRADVGDVFTPLDPSRARALAGDAWTFGLRAVLSAQRLVQESRLEDIGSSLVIDIERRFQAAMAQQQASLCDEMRGYFDPREGKVTMLFEAFLKDGGEFSRTLATYLAPESGALAKTLSREIGESSVLLRRLHPTDAEGFLSMVERAFQNALQQNQVNLTHALDPHASDSAVARLMGELRREMSKADKDHTEKLAAVMKILDANDEVSPLSRLLREAEAATRAVMQSMNPEVPGSGLALLTSSLTGLLDRHGKRQDEALAAFDERQRKLERSVLDAVVGLDQRRQSDAQSTKGGRTFEDAVAMFVQGTAECAGVIAEAVGSTVGHRPNSKVGDIVLRQGPDSLYAGSTLVIEAKRDKAYGVARALEELATARANRGATAGLFVMARSHAPAGFAGFRRFGDDILVVWDPEDTSTDAYLEAAVSVGLMLAARSRRPEDQGQLDALADIEQRVTKEIERHEKVQKLTTRIREDAETISEQLQTSNKQLGVLVKKARQTLKALNVELIDVAEEQKHPIGLLPGATSRGRKALGSGDQG